MTEQNTQDAHPTPPPPPATERDTHMQRRPLVVTLVAAVLITQSLPKLAPLFYIFAGISGPTSRSVISPGYLLEITTPVIGMLSLIFGFGILACMNWARIGAIVSLVFALMVYVAHFITQISYLPSLLGGTHIAGRLSLFVGGFATFIAGIALALVIIHILTRPEVKDAFRNPKETTHD